MHLSLLSLPEELGFRAGWERGVPYARVPWAGKSIAVLGAGRSACGQLLSWLKGQESERKAKGKARDALCPSSAGALGKASRRNSSSLHLSESSGSPFS